MRIGPGQHGLSLDYKVCRVAIFARTYGARDPIVVSVNANGRSSPVNTSESKRELQLRKKLVCTNLFPRFTIISGLLLAIQLERTQPDKPAVDVRQPGWRRARTTPS